VNNKRYPELGYYTLPGHTLSPQDIFREVLQGERLGLGSVWISERNNTKNAEVLSGVAASLTSKMGIASGLISNLPLRSPLVMASYASTMMHLTDDRFALGIGRGVDPLADATGTPRLNFRLLEDYIDVLRRLWRGETVDHRGPSGNFKRLTLGADLKTIPPVIAAAMGDKTCYWAGRVCDGVLFNSLWSKRAVEYSTRLVRKGAEDAGRDPASVKVWTVLVTACDVPEEAMLRYIVRRMNTYLLFPEMFDDICRANGWDKRIAERIRGVMRQFDGPDKSGLLGDEGTSRDLDDLRRTRDLYPQSWIKEGNAEGTAQECVQAVLDRFDAGADGVVFHGTTPEHLTSLLELWPKYRPAGRFAGRSVNPGL
jgi:probable F420-dependent oxidoreductase